MLYFAYGANLNLRGMKRRCPKAVPRGTATLPGYTLEFRVFATIVPTPKANVLGALFEITPACTRALDEYEGPDYTKITVTVETPEGPREAVAYVMTSGVRSPPSVAYYGEIARGYQNWKLDEAHLRRARLATLHPVKPEKKGVRAGEVGSP